MRRRDFLATLGSAAAWPLAARAQQPAVPVVAFLNGASAWEYATLADAFREGLSGSGYVEGRNVLVEYHWADGHYERLPVFAADLARRGVAAIFANGPAVVAAKAATTTIPIVFAVGLDPVTAGLVTNLNRPGGNVTGFTSLLDEIGPKRLQLLHELVPTAATIAALINPAYPTAESQAKESEEAGSKLGFRVDVVRAAAEGDFVELFATLAQRRVGALLIGSDPFFNSRSEQLAALTLRHSVPAMHVTREFVVAGGLMSYGGSLAETYRLAGAYIGRILKGEKPGDLPVQQSTKIELVINLKTAKALGLNVPSSILVAADEIIE
jgi:putative ABC transport system substrate-binding protein